MTLVIKTPDLVTGGLGARPGSYAEVLQSWFGGGAWGFMFDFTRLDGLFQDTDGLVPVTAAGQRVALARDLSGNGRDAVQETLNNRPYMRQTAGRWYLDCTGNPGTHRLRVQFGQTMAFRDRVIMAAATWTDAGGSGKYPLVSGQSATNNVATIGCTTSMNAFVRVVSGQTQGPVLGLNSPHIITGLNRAGSATQTIRVDGTDEVSEVLTPDADTASYADIGGYTSGSGMRGYIHGVGYVANPVADYALAEAYFAGRIGLTLP